MRVFPSLLTSVAALLCVVGGVAVASAQGAPPAPAGAENLPNLPGKEQIIQSCSSCHQPDIVIGQKRDAAAWRELVDQMIARGANVEEGKYDEIIAYLTQAS